MRRVRRIVTGALSAALFAGGMAELSLAGAGSANGAANATTINLAPVADTYVTAASPSHVWGHANQIQAGHQAAHRKTAYLRFQLPTLTGNKVLSARLILTRTNHHLGGTVQLRRASNTRWTESTMTARNAGASGAVLSSVATTSTTHSVALNVPASALTGNSISLTLTSSSTTNFLAFRSREWGSGAPALQLTVQPVAAGVHPTSRAPSSAPATHSSSATPKPTPTPTTSTPATTPPASSSSSSAQPPSSSSSSTSAAPVPPPSTGSNCSVSAKLVPSCGYWWGIAPKAHTSTARDVALAQDEQEAQTTFGLMHTYHQNDELFPTDTERAIATDSGKNRVLLINWKPATDMTWAAVADGKADARIDRLAKYINSTFPYPFFLSIWHEPENDLNQSAGSGMTAQDYAAMFRHVVLRLRADGATAPVIVMDYMGFDNYALQSWFPQLWPGDDVVDWIGIDPYGSGTSGDYKADDFATLVNRKINGFAGYYSWATTNHPGKPIMLAEWGVNEGTNNPDGKAAFFNSVSSQLPSFPAIKALAYFDENIPNASTAGTTTSPDTSPKSLAAFRQLCHWAAAQGAHPRYGADNVEAFR